MRAALLYGQNDVRVDDIDDPRPGAGEVKIKVAAVGVCHSDLNFVTGAIETPFPIVLGHEGAGVVTEVGPGVSSIGVGDHVLCSILGPCTQCFQCLHGSPNLCESSPSFTGKMLDGTTRLSKNGAPVYTLHYQGSFAEYAIAPERFLTPIRRDAPLDVVCGLSCGLSTGLGAALVRAQVQPGSIAVVTGAGGVGLAAMMGARFAGATTVIAADIRRHKAEKAVELGFATHCIDTTAADLAPFVHALSGGRGADYAFDAAGAPGTLEALVAATRPGATIVVIGRTHDKVEARIDTRALLRQRVITGTFGGSIDPKRHIPIFVDLFMQGRLDLRAILDTRYSLDQVAQALDDLHEGRVTRGVIVM